MATGGVSVDTSDEIFDNVCSVCKKQNKNTNATKYCVDCHDYYCSNCVNIHKTVPALEGHKILDKNEGQSGKLPMVPTARCDRHSFKPVDMYCQGHKAVGCYTCMAVEHRTCQDVFYIPEYVNARANIVPEFLQRMANTEKKLESLLKMFKGEGISLQANKLREIEKVKAFTKRLEERIKEAEKDAISEVEHKYRELDEKLNKDIDKLQEELKNVRSTKAGIRATIQNESQSFVTMASSEKDALAAEETSTQSGNIKLGKRVKFLLDPQNESLMSRELCLGKVVILPYNFVHKGEFSIKCSSDTSPSNIYGSCVLSDGAILLADRGNNKLKLIKDVPSNVTDHFSLSSAPWDVCCIEDNKVAVCLPDEKKVQIFKVTNTLSSDRLIKLDFNCRGISYHDDTFYISDKSSLYICNKEGIILKTISKDSTGKPMFSNIYNVSVNRHNKHLFVNDGKGVICLDTDGNIINVVSNEIKYAHGITPADNGKMFACGFLSKNVITLDENGGLEDVVIKSGLDPPQALCFNCNTGYMYVPNNCRNNVQIYVLQQVYEECYI